LCNSTDTFLNYGGCNSWAYVYIFVITGKCLFLAGLIPIPLTGMQDYMALDYGIGLTNIVPRTTPGSKDLSR